MDLNMNSQQQSEETDMFGTPANFDLLKNTIVAPTSSGNAQRARASIFAIEQLLRSAGANGSSGADGAPSLSMDFSSPLIPPPPPPAIHGKNDSAEFANRPMTITTGMNSLFSTANNMNTARRQKPTSATTAAAANSMRNSGSPTKGATIKKEKKKALKRTMSPKSSHPCDVCNKFFASRQGLNNHVATVHLRQRDFACPECPKKFSANGSLKRHIDTVHRGKRRFECNICFKLFALKHHLKNHALTVHGTDKVNFEPIPTVVTKAKKPSPKKTKKVKSLREFVEGQQRPMSLDMANPHDQNLLQQQQQQQQVQLHQQQQQQQQQQQMLHQQMLHQQQQQQQQLQQQQLQQQQQQQDQFRGLLDDGQTTHKFAPSLSNGSIDMNILSSAWNKGIESSSRRQSTRSDAIFPSNIVFGNTINKMSTSSPSNTELGSPVIT